MDKLDCGHDRPILPSDHTGGTGHGTYDGKTYCYACCAERDRADMIATGRATLYLGQPYGGPIGRVYRVTNWPGSLWFPIIRHSASRNGGGFGSQRTDAWFVGPDGYVWHAVNRGDMDIARCKRTKVKA